MEQWQARGSAVCFCNSEFFSLAEEVEFKAERRNQYADSQVTHQGPVSQAKDFDLFQ